MDEGCILTVYQNIDSTDSKVEWRKVLTGCLGKGVNTLRTIL